VAALSGRALACPSTRVESGQWRLLEALLEGTVGFVEALLVVMGAVLVLLAFGLAFTVYGEVSFVAGVGCFVAAALVFVHRVNALGKARPGQQRPGPR